MFHSPADAAAVSLETTRELLCLNTLFLLHETVTTSTLLKDLWDRDADAVDNLCNHLNQRYNSRVRGWRRLGHKLKIKKDVLDTLSPNEGEVISPTEALFSHLGGAKVWLTMENLIEALVSIDRKDALSVIKDYFPG